MFSTRPWWSIDVNWHMVQIFLIWWSWNPHLLPGVCNQVLDAATSSYHIWPSRTVLKKSSWPGEARSHTSLHGMKCCVELCTWIFSQHDQRLKTDGGSLFEIKFDEYLLAIAPILSYTQSMIFISRGLHLREPSPNPQTPCYQLLQYAILCVVWTMHCFELE